MPDAPHDVPSAMIDDADSGLQHAISLLEDSSELDSQWYLERYLDARMLGMGAAEHYLRLGARMLRDPGPGFSTEFYLASNQDVARSTLNPCLHYVANGRDEGRLPLPEWPDVTAVAQTPPPADAPVAQTPPPANAPAALPVVGVRVAEHFSPEQLAKLRAEFDQAYYAAATTLVAGVDAFEDFMTEGWRRGLDPNPTFSTRYYLRRYQDVAEAGINPFAHYLFFGRAENRQPLSPGRIAQFDHMPKVSVVVPNYNHGAFLPQRIDSILAQTYPHVDVLLLDDCSSDDSREVIADYCRRFPDRVRAIYNDTNSGNVFRQWRKGMENVDGELVWICESDDFCEPDFLEQLVPWFADRSINIAFGRIQFADAQGKFQAGLDAYREGAEPGIWNTPLARPASRWFAGGFGVNNVIANVGGCVLRRQELREEIWSEAQTYRVLGDWFLYCHLAGGGQIAYEPGAVAYFRQHGGNTSVVSFKTPGYYVEHQRLMMTLKQRWDIPDATVERFVANIVHQYRHFQVADAHGDFEQHVDQQALLDQRRSRPHILMGFLGFEPGGGEFFPMHLANELHAQGCLVSMLVFRHEYRNAEMAMELAPAIPVYDVSHLRELGTDAFLADAGVSLVHSHMVMLETAFFDGRQSPLAVPYLVTLHGSYEACNVEGERAAQWAWGVNHWVYTAERNLQPFATLDIPPERFTKLPNGMPVDPLPFPRSRMDMGIAQDAVVFTLVARAIERKGWHTSLQAFDALRRRHPGRAMHLLMCGDGELADRLAAEHAADPDITFLGFQSRISGLYRLSDCATVPTRYEGESFPLCLIQALQVGTPAISTRMGEIEAMFGDSGAGILIDPVPDTATFAASLADAMETMLDEGRRLEMARAAVMVGEPYTIEVIAGRYREVYGALLEAETSPVGH